MKKIKVAMIGFGGIARSHYRAYSKLALDNAPIELVAVCDIDPQKFTTKVKINLDNTEALLPDEIHKYTDADELLNKEDFDMVDICLPSYLHKEYAIKLLRAGKHVLCEKPMALSTDECKEMLAAAKESSGRFMIGQCLRFNSLYQFLKECIDSGKYGKLRQLHLDRRSSHPKWGFENWFSKTEKSGGCILDMHIHDIDMVRFLLGEPYAVSAVTYDTITKWSVENSRLYYKDVVAIVNGSWDESESSGFYYGYRAGFDKATVILDNGKLTVYPRDGEAFTPDIPKADHIVEEIRYFAETIIEGKDNLANPPESACESVRLIEKLRESSAKNGETVDI